MPKLPPADASADVWHNFAEARCEDILPHLGKFILERFAYKPRYIQQRVSKSFGTISARTKQFDLYFRLFAQPDDVCPRDCLVIARIGFKQQRVGHGRALIELLVELAPQFGYRFLAVECANANSSAFAERLGFSPYDNRRHWVGSVDAIREALEQQAA